MKISDLIGVLNESIVTKTILVPSNDFYARPGDTEEYTLEYICPGELLAKLNSILKIDGDI